LLYAVGFETKFEDAGSSKATFVLLQPDVAVLKSALSVIDVFMNYIIAPFDGASNETLSISSAPLPEIVECSIDKKRAKRGEIEISRQPFPMSHGVCNAGTVILNVQFPDHSNINLVSNVIIGPSGVNHAQLKFVPEEGRFSWAVGIVPTRELNEDSIWQSNLSWACKGEYLPDHLEQANVIELEEAAKNRDVCTLSVEYSSRNMTLSVAGRVVRTRSIPLSEFPLRLGIVGPFCRFQVIAPARPSIIVRSARPLESRFHSRLSLRECCEAIQSVLGDGL
jgi:hypothetical protein